MTSFPPPPPPGPPYPPVGTHGPGGFVQRGPAPMSGVSVAAFVFSWLVCLPVVNAVVGIILAIVGLVQTRDGARRGRGLAIAAIPISIVTGIGGAIVLAAFYFAGGLLVQIGTFTMELDQAAGDPAAVARVIYDRCSADFTAAVSRERFEAWWVERVGPRGTFQTVEASGKDPMKRGDAMVFELIGKFQSGNVPIEISIQAPESGAKILRGFKLVIEDIKFDGVSPFDSP